MDAERCFLVLGYGYNFVLVLTSGIDSTCHFSSHRKLELGHRPKERKRGAKGRKAYIGMEMRTRKKRRNSG